MRKNTVEENPRYCGNKFCGGLLVPNLDEDGNNVPVCIICGLTYQRGLDKMKEIEQSKPHRAGLKAEAEAKKRKQEENDIQEKGLEDAAKINGMKIVSEGSKVVLVPEAKTKASSETGAALPHKKVSDFKNKMAKSKFIKANLKAIGADMERMGIEQTAHEWGTNDVTLNKYQKMGLLPYRAEVKLRAKSAKRKKGAQPGNKNAAGRAAQVKPVEKPVAVTGVNTEARADKVAGEMLDRFKNAPPSPGEIKTCNACRQGFLTAEDLVKHLQLVHGMNPHTIKMMGGNTVVLPAGAVQYGSSFKSFDLPVVVEVRAGLDAASVEHIERLTESNEALRAALPQLPKWRWWWAFLPAVAKRWFDSFDKIAAGAAK